MQILAIGCPCSIDVPHLADSRFDKVTTFPDARRVYFVDGDTDVEAPCLYLHLEPRHVFAARRHLALELTSAEAHPHG